MKALVCELCNSNDFVKQDGLFVCQHCGTKYTLEEARKMMVEGVVQVQGTVKIDTSAELERLLQAARNARETGDDVSAIRHYERISAIDPDNWEALFYLVVLKTNEITNGQIHSAAVSVSNCLPKIFHMINERISDETAKKEAVWEVIQQCQTTAEWLTAASHNYYKSSIKGNGVMAFTGLIGAVSSAGSTLSALSEDTTRCVAIANIMFYCGNHISAIFDMNDGDYSGHAVWAWQQALNFHTDYRRHHSTQPLFDPQSVQRLTDYINQYAPIMLEDIIGDDEPGLAVLTVEYDSNASSAGLLLYSIDGGEKCKLNRKERATFFLEYGTHTISILNPIVGRKHTFQLNGPQTIHVYGKAFSMDIY